MVNVDLDVKGAVRRQFAPVAAQYAHSSVHAGGPDLEAMVEAARLRGGERVLDVGCGPGHTALAFAARGAVIEALDLSDEMLVEGRRLAAERGLPNVTFRRGDVDDLPFPDHSFDLVTSRYSAHHYPHPERALGEIARVLRPGGALLLVDVVAPDDPLPDTFLNAVELLRDPSHVRDHTVAQWAEALRRAGLEPEALGTWPLRLDFAAWVARMRTPEPTVAQLRSLMRGAAAEVRAAYNVEADCSFSVPVALIQGRAR